jgi:PAS domain S-box-containing protein
MHATDNSIHVLLIEDNPGDVRLISEMLQEAKGRKIVLEHCATLTQGLQALSKNDFSILLLDLTLPDSIGFDTFVKVYTQNPQIPIVVLTGTNDEELAIKSVRTGAQDYLIKGQIDGSLLSRSISYAIERAGLLRVVQQELIERKAMESMLRKINRALHVLSECNEIVVRATEENVLAEKICGAITILGEYQFAWVAFTEPNDVKSIQPIAIVGSKDGNSPEEASAWFKRDPDSPLSEALKTGKVVVCDDVTVDKRCSNLRAEADKLGYRSFVILPLVTGGKTLGVVQICSREPDRFDSEELKLLDELKEDIAYAIVSIRTEKERKQTEEALRESEEIFDQFLTKSPVLVYIKDEQHRFKKLSKSFENLFGKPASELLGKDLYDLLPSELAKIVFEDDQAVLKGDKVVRTEEKLGDLFYSSIKFPIHREAGKPNYLGGLSVDITERKRAEEELRESEKKFRKLLESTPLPLCYVNKDGVITFRNERFVKVFGYTESEVPTLAEWWMNAYPENNYRTWVVQNWESAVRRASETGTDIESEVYHVTCKNGSVREIIISGITINDNFLSTFVDITERKRAEEALRESESRFRITFDYAPVGISLTKIDGSFVQANNALCKMLGYSQEELLTKSFYDISHPEDIELSKSMVAKAIDGEGLILGFEKRYIGKDGQTIWVENSSSLLRDNKEKPLYFIVQTINITGRKQLEEGLRQMQKLEGLGTLAGGIAHDFNNILGIILAYITSTNRFKDDTKKLDLAVNTIVKAVERGKTLVQQILMFARKTETSYGAVNVNDVVMEIVNMIYEMFPKTVTCSQNFDKSIPYINADRSQLHQVLMNLCINSRDAMPKGGVLGINTRMVSVASLRAQHPDADGSSYVCIEVSDSGEGMTEETRKRIFEPFFTTKDIGKGTGLGLSVVFGVIQAHKGFIDVESELDKGTTFRLYLPTSQAAMPLSIKEEITLEEMLGGTETLLIVEDEEMLLMSLQIVLIDKGYKVLSAKDGLKALKIYQERKNDIALVLTDLGLPKMNGMEVCQRIKTINPNEHVILATGYLDPEMKSEFLKAGIQHFLYKPYDLRQVLKVIREVLDGK